MNLLKKLEHVYSWYKYQYYFSFSLSIFSAFWYWFNPFEQGLVDGSLILISLISCFAVFKADHPSWKYIQSLPLSRKELYHFKIFDTALSFLPLFVWIILFHQVVWESISDDKTISLESFSKLMMISLLGVCFVSIHSFQNLYDKSRSPYNRGNQKKLLFQRYRDCLYALTCGAVVFSLCGLLKHYFGHYLPSLGFLKDFLEYFVSMWTLIGFFSWICFFQFKHVFTKWMDEKRSYVKLTWNPRKDLSLMGTCLVLIVGSVMVLTGLTPSDYGESKLVDAVFSKKIDRVMLVLNNGENINAPSSTGFTALMVAADQGNLEMYRFLLEKGASKFGKVTSGSKAYIGKEPFYFAVAGGELLIIKDLFKKEALKNHKGDNYPLHHASFKCHRDVIDFLLEEGADPGYQNSKGRTALHVASENNCINGVISLIEAGADPLLKDKSGKAPKDYLKNYNKELAYYLTKKSRMPAGK